jgi:hypothetical protein
LKESAQVGDTPLFITLKDALRYQSSEGADQFHLVLVATNEWTDEEMPLDGPFDFPDNDVQLPWGEFVIRIVNLDCNACSSSMIIEETESV